MYSETIANKRVKLVKLVKGGDLIFLFVFPRKYELLMIAISRLCHRDHLQRGLFCQFTFRWIHYYDSNRSIGLETGKSHL